MSDESTLAPAKQLRRHKIAIVILAVMFVFSLLAIPVAFVIGAVLGTSQVYNQTALGQEVRMVEFFAEYPERYGTLEVEPASSGFAYPFGKVQSQDDYDFLDENLQRIFGDELGKLMMSGGVSVAKKQVPQDPFPH